MNVIEQSRQSMVDDLGIGTLPAQMQDEILAGVGENIIKAVTLAALLKLPPEAQEEFKKLSEAGDETGITALLKKHIENPDAFITQEAQKEIAAFKETLAQTLAA